MAGAFSGHLINSFEQATQVCAPFGQPMNPNISINGPMSFNRQMHGNFSAISQPSFSLPNDQSLYMDMSENAMKKIAELQAKLDMKLGPEFVSQRPGPGGGPKLTYAEGWKIINLANEVFGFNGWSSNVVSLSTDFIDFSEESKRYTVGVTAVVRVTLRDGVFHEDIGYGMLENSKSKGAALDKCKKEAVTDAIKRSLRNFGNLLGNCLYDKSYASEVVKIKVPPAKFNKSQLYRRPEFQDPGPSDAGPSGTTSSTSGASSSTVNVGSSSRPNVTNTAVKTDPPSVHVKPGSTSHYPAAAAPAYVYSNPKPPSTTSTSTWKGKSPDQSTSAQNRNPVQTSNSNAPPGLAQQPLPIQPAHIRRVSFAPNPPPAPPVQKAEPEPADDSFTFSSEDDAFLAALADADSGLGGHIDFDEGHSGVEISVASGSGSPLGARASEQVANVSSAAQKRSYQTESRIQPQQQRPSLPQPDRDTSASTSALHHQKANSGSGPRTSSVNAVRAALALQEQNAQKNAQSSASASNTSTSSRPQVPSMGGFHFPPGVKPPSDSRPPQPQQRSSNSNSSSTAGMKRPADAMNSGTGQGRRLMQGPGMGLAQEGRREARREPFGELEVGEGGDVKRVRR